MVLNKAQGFFNQVISTRAWNSMHGGVYVEVTEETKPNPYLRIKNRDVITTTGMQLTKINPSYMTRQIAEINKTKLDIQFHITSLNPIRPGNFVDVWEKRALKRKFT